MPDNWRQVVEKVTDPLPRNRYPDAKAMRDAVVALGAERDQKSDLGS
jgi:hypothetical protein